MNTIREDAEIIIRRSIDEMLPEESVNKALSSYPCFQKGVKTPVYVVSVGKAAYRMADAARVFLGDRLVKGLIITKYGHAGSALCGFEIIEAGHPIPDVNSVKAATAALDMVRSLGKDDAILMLISGGGSALFEKPAVGLSLNDIEDVTKALLACGADIGEINAIRKRLSEVKGGRFALAAAPAQVYAVILSDVLGDMPETIASGPVSPETSDSGFVFEVLKKYGLTFNDAITGRLKTEPPKVLDNVEINICGGVGGLCRAAADQAKRLGYEPYILTMSLNCEAREAGRFIGAIGRDTINKQTFAAPCAIICGGETVVTVKGKGAGGRNQELALAAAGEIAGLSDIVIFSVGSDGTDGPTDAAGGIVDGKTKESLSALGLSIPGILAESDSYNGLMACGGLIVTGPTGTNVNDISVILCR